VYTLERKKERKKEGDGKKEQNTKIDSVPVQRKILFFITFLLHGCGGFVL